MIFLDTSGILALAMQNDDFHDHAMNMMRSADSGRERICVHSYILVEASALIQRRIGSEAVIEFLKSASLFDVVWVDPRLHNQAIEYIERNGTSKLSFVDVVSFLTMRFRGITEFIGFDKHFIEAGFIQYGSKNS